MDERSVMFQLYSGCQVPRWVGWRGPRDRLSWRGSSFLTATVTPVRGMQCRSGSPQSTITSVFPPACRATTELSYREVVMDAFACPSCRGALEELGENNHQCLKCKCVCTLEKEKRAVWPDGTTIASYSCLLDGIWSYAAERSKEYVWDSLHV